MSINTAFASMAPGTPRFICSVCNEGFLLKSYLLDHCRRVHQSTSQPLHRCHICHRTLSTQSNLTVHMQVHRSERSPEHRCHLCSMAYYHRSALHRHQRKEHGMDKRRRGRKRSHNGSDDDGVGGTSNGLWHSEGRDDCMPLQSLPGSPTTPTLAVNHRASLHSASRSGMHYYGARAGGRGSSSSSSGGGGRFVQSAPCSPTPATPLQQLH
ncbi:hypothetical protein BASA62_004111 [Batrachochytrium salamandrivorans]|nr:hypothetical protein BASA62_004111 [Batrachochytrium salamandrivorans]